jgi:hypothetical protein
MEDFKVLSVLKKFIPTEQYEALKDELGKFEVELNTDITKYVTANTPNMEDLVVEAKKTAHQEVIKELKIKDVETVDQLNEHMKTVKLSSTDQANEVTRLTTELEEKTGLYDTEVANRTQLETEAKATNETALIKELKITTFDVTDKDHVEFLRTKFNKEVTEELPFSDVVTSYQEANVIETPKRFGDPRFVKQKIVQSGEEDGYEIYQRLKKEGKV